MIHLDRFMFRGYSRLHAASFPRSSPEFERPHLMMLSETSEDLNQGKLPA